MDNSKRVIYNSAIAKEIEWRKTASVDDILTLDTMLKAIREIGTDAYYLADITNRKINDNKILSIIKNTMLHWDDKGIEAMLIGVIGTKNNLSATALIIKSYEELPDANRKQYHAFYDNALANICDKRFSDKYLEWANSWREVANFPLLMCKLGEWDLMQAKDSLINQLFSRVEYELYNPIEFWTQRNQAYINAICALESFKVYDEQIFNALTKLYNETDCQNIKERAYQAIKKIQRKK